MEKLIPVYSTSDFDYELPGELIAQTPLTDRQSSRLLCLNRENGKIQHRRFCDILDYINPGDCLVINNTRVIPARLYGKKQGSGGEVEFLLLRPQGGDTWEVLVRPGKRLKEGHIVEFGEGELTAKILSRTGESGGRIVSFFCEGNFRDILDKLGEAPLPHYITKRLEDRERYQTVYSKIEGSCAAPTAGLHFTQELINKIEEKGAAIARITLHVGVGTFRPITTDNISAHHMHSEWFEIDREAADVINNTKRGGGRIIAVGTTSVRTLESCADELGYITPGRGETDIFIYPPYRYKAVDAIITNFHLPKSTLVMLVSAFSTKDNVLFAYSQAKAKGYRFFSFGDAMYIGTNV